MTGNSGDKLIELRKPLLLGNSGWYYIYRYSVIIAEQPRVIDSCILIESVCHTPKMANPK